MPISLIRYCSFKSLSWRKVFLLASAKAQPDLTDGKFAMIERHKIVLDVGCEFDSSSVSRTKTGWPWVAGLDCALTNDGILSA